METKINLERRRIVGAIGDNGIVFGYYLPIVKQRQNRHGPVTYYAGGETKITSFNDNCVIDIMTISAAQQSIRWMNCHRRRNISRDGERSDRIGNAIDRTGKT